MSTAGPSNSSVPKESKSALKKKAKAEALAKAQAPAAESEATGESIRVESPTNGMEFSSESPYVKELYKYDWEHRTRRTLCLGSAADLLHAGISVTSRRSS